MRGAAEGFRMKRPFVATWPFSLRLGENGRIVTNSEITCQTPRVYFNNECI